MPSYEGISFFTEKNRHTKIQTQYMKIRETITREKVLDIVAHHENTIFYDWFTVSFGYKSINDI